ncbi:MAG: class I SAM-dependent methyltransferase family protein, partial [Candidatus Lutacidiplasmatales archaeon]
PAALHGRARRVVAVEQNPVSFGYLEENVVLNHLEAVVEPLRGDNRTVRIDPGHADRVFLGYLPTSLPWTGRAVGLIRPEGGWIHVHLLEGTKATLRSSEERVRDEIADAGATAGIVVARRVKPYSPGREHRVVDAEVRSR